MSNRLNIAGSFDAQQTYAEVLLASLQQLKEKDHVMRVMAYFQEKQQEELIRSRDAIIKDRKTPVLQPSISELTKALIAELTKNAQTLANQFIKELQNFMANSKNFTNLVKSFKNLLDTVGVKNSKKDVDALITDIERHADTVTADYAAPTDATTSASIEPTPTTSASTTSVEEDTVNSTTKETEENATSANNNRPIYPDIDQVFKAIEFRNIVEAFLMQLNPINNPVNRDLLSVSAHLFAQTLFAYKLEKNLGQLLSAKTKLTDYPGAYALHGSLSTGAPHPSPTTTSNVKKPRISN